jgi:signal transduction histidine kinase
MLLGMGNTEHPWPAILRLVAHQLRLPTSLIAGYLEMLGSDEIQGDPVRRRAILAQMRQSIRELNRLALQLQEASRSASGALPIRKRRIAIDSLIEEARQAAIPLCEYRNVELHVQGPAMSGDGWVVGDPYYLKMCLVNLIDNAAKYGKPRGQVSLATRPLGELVEMRVLDEGAGLGPNAARLFAPFVREPRGGEGIDEGMGLGLALVKIIVEAHGGSMTWSSERPSYVGFRLPLSAN